VSSELLSSLVAESESHYTGTAFQGPAALRPRRTHRRAEDSCRSRPPRGFQKGTLSRNLFLRPNISICLTRISRQLLKRETEILNFALADGEGTQGNFQIILRWFQEGMLLRIIPSGPKISIYLACFPWQQRHAQYKAGHMLYRGNGIKRDQTNGLEWCRKAIIYRERLPRDQYAWSTSFAGRGCRTSGGSARLDVNKTLFYGIRREYSLNGQRFVTL
jgi:hypothetical protein